MGFYREHLLPRLIDRVCSSPEMTRLRQQVCSGLRGEVVEVGFGSGLNVPHYPAAVTGVAAVEPNDLAWRLAHGRLAASPLRVRRAGLDGEHLPFDDDSFDAALSTWTMCTIPDLPAALAELRRVLRPGGTLHFLEHGLAPDPGVQRWQHLLNPLQRHVGGGCNLDRPIRDLITEAGFAITDVEVFYQQHAPRFAGAESLGVAVSR